MPRQLREELGLKVGERVLMARDAEGLRILTLDQAVAHAQALVAQAIPPEIDLQADLRMLRDRDLADEARHS